MKNPTIAFFGTPELCVPILEALTDADMTPSLVVTNPDRPIGRKQIITPPPVKVWGLAHDIPVLQPEKIDAAFLEEFKAHNIDLSIVVAYGSILPEKLINMPKHGTLNIHYSLLPKYRGATPVESVILHGDTETGVAIQNMVYELDAGDILAIAKHPINPNITAPDLRDELNTIGAKLLVETIPRWIAGEITPTKQDGSQVTKCGRIKKSDGQIDLEKMSDTELWNRYRAYYGWPGVFYFDKDGKRVKVTEAVFENNKFQIKKVIPEGSREMTL